MKEADDNWHLGTDEEIIAKFEATIAEMEAEQAKENLGKKGEDEVPDDSQFEGVVEEANKVWDAGKVVIYSTPEGQFGAALKPSGFWAWLSKILRR